MKLFLSILAVCTLVSLILYAQQLFRWRRGMQELFQRPRNAEAKGDGEGISIIVPLRNEMGNWERLFEDLRKQVIGKGDRELILVDDHSEDGSAEATEKLCEERSECRALRLPEGEYGKKRALAKGIREASFEWILTLDADVRVEGKILDRLEGVLQEDEAELLLFPILPHSPKGLWQELVHYEALALLGVMMGSAGIGKPVLASGAALSFKKSAYQELGGYKEHLHIDSGDDIFLLQDMLRAGKEVRAIPDPALLVRTSYPASGREWVSQRLRWASKAKGYRDRGALLSFGTLIAANGLLVLSTFLFPLYSLFFPVLLISWGVKGGVDRIFLILPQRKFGKGFSWKYFPLALLLYPFQIGSLFLIRVSWRLEWKGRKISDH